MDNGFNNRLLNKIESTEGYYYGIPMLVFHVNGRELQWQQKSIEKLYNNIDTSSRAKKLMRDMEIYEEYPSFVPQASIRGDTQRKILNIAYLSSEDISQLCGMSKFSNSSERFYT